MFHSFSSYSEDYVCYSKTGITKTFSSSRCLLARVLSSPDPAIAVVTVTKLLCKVVHWFTNCYSKDCPADRWLSLMQGCSTIINLLISGLTLHLPATRLPRIRGSKFLSISWLQIWDPIIAAWINERSVLGELFYRGLAIFTFEIVTFFMSSYVKYEDLSSVGDM